MVAPHWILGATPGTVFARMYLLHAGIFSPSDAREWLSWHSGCVIPCTGSVAGNPIRKQKMVKVYVGGRSGKPEDKRVCMFDWIMDAFMYAETAARDYGAHVVVAGGAAYGIDAKGEPYRYPTMVHMIRAGVPLMVRLDFFGVNQYSDGDAIGVAINEAVLGRNTRNRDREADAAVMWRWFEQRENGHSPAWSAGYDLDVSAAFLEDYCANLGFTMRDR
jgi:hypothetical protein